MEDELDYYALYGVEKPEEEPAEEPAGNPEETGEAQEPEVETGDGVEPQEETGEPETRQSGEEVAGTGVDLEAQIQRIREEQQQQMDEMIAGMKLTDPYNGGAPITTQAQYQKYLEAHNAARLENLRRQSGLSEADFQELIDSIPAVQQAKATQAAAQAASEAAAREQAQQQLQRELTEIGKLCPEIRDAETLVQHKSWPKVEALMQKGLGALDAFRTANFEELANQSAAAVRKQQTRNAAGKDHLRGTGGKGNGGVTVPPEVMREYRRYNPKATDAQIQAHYARRHKN